MTQKSDEKDFESFRKLYPELSQGDLEEAKYNFDRYVETALAVFNSIPGDAERIDLLRKLVGTLDLGISAKTKRAEACRALRLPDEPVPLDDLIKETRNRKMEIFDALIVRPDLLYDLALISEKRQIIDIVTTNRRVDSEGLYLTYRKPFDIIAARPKGKQLSPNDTLSVFVPIEKKGQRRTVHPSEPSTTSRPQVLDWESYN
jgi:hypothetical protein